MTLNSELEVQLHTRWFESGTAGQPKFRDSFVALLPSGGVKFSDRDGEKFALKLSALSDKEREEITVLHTASYR